MTLLDELEQIALAAVPYAPAGHGVSAVLAAEPYVGDRCYLCAFAAGDEERAWLVLDNAGRPVAERRRVRDVVTMAALCEIAVEAAAGGDLDALLARLVALRITEAPAGIDEAESAVRALQQTVGTPPQLATPDRLDAIGLAARRLELALDAAASSPFTAAMRGVQGVVDDLLAEVETAYLVALV